ncbi:DUF202 domain-containing protein [Nocardia mangyaensis]|uniref:DUF202 domain-containing protein n=1 Tax=Nocardia mangyaensis TaxID=2213200 RepID=UPI002676C7ED|nr:DUF202 domain-containing protein [Nocardia mangyaensis]MDO3646048.1 DUF202 domain-containing protein [Nocardia mangyaensis]
MTAPTLAMERTALAWRRTGLGAAACAMLFVHAAATQGSTAVLPLAAAAVSLLLTCLGWARGRALDHGRMPPGHRPVATTTVAIALVALIALGSVLLDG